MYDKIGYWSEIKLDIIREYASAYSKILSANEYLHHIYVDAFAGAGKHISRDTGEFVSGSPLNALQINPPFEEYHFIDLDQQKIGSLEALAGKRRDVNIYHGDCNQVMLEKILPIVRYEDYRRALCVLDPYKINLDWEVIYGLGQTKTFDVFINFMVSDMNRNILWRNPERVSQVQIERMNRFWGDGSWREQAYAASSQMSLFEDPNLEKVSNDAVAEIFRKRLKEVAGFQYVPKPIPMRNRRNATVYYLFFASHVPVAKDIVSDIFKKHESRKG